jgi:hypothetical protein
MEELPSTQRTRVWLWENWGGGADSARTDPLQNCVCLRPPDAEHCLMVKACECASAEQWERNVRQAMTGRWGLALIDALFNATPLRFVRG